VCFVNFVNAARYSRPSWLRSGVDDAPDPSGHDGGHPRARASSWMKASICGSQKFQEWSWPGTSWYSWAMPRVSSDATSRRLAGSSESSVPQET
jgi:hypothetical protein